MKLIALKNISARLRKGATFEQPGSRAKTLIAIGLAKAADEPQEAPRSRRTYRRRDLQAEP